MAKHIIYSKGDIVGNCTFILETKPGGKNRRAIFMCKCGNEFESLLTNVKYHGYGCGCKRGNITHGYARGGHTSEYRSWGTMKARCYNIKNHKYYRYGGRGITVCDRWMKFENFIEDMGKKPKPGLSIERKNNDGNYEPQNCIWGTQKEQARNRSTSTMLTFNGETKCVAQWAEDLSISASVIYQRMYSLKWPIEKCLTKKVRPLNNKKKMGPKRNGIE